jgi:type IV pilus assembly protein PilV
MYLKPLPERERGFTMVEVMVALIIVAIGLLGVAKMQALALSSTGVSRSRALAAIEASSLGSAMHADRAFWSSSGNPAFTVNVSNSGAGVAGTTVTSTLGALNGAISLASAAYVPASDGGFCNFGGGAAPCSIINVAGDDLYAWAVSLNNLLPASTASINCVTTNTPVNCTVQINWVENAVAINSTEAANAGAAASFQTASYTLYVVP